MPLRCNDSLGRCFKKNHLHELPSLELEKFKSDGTVENVSKKHSGRPRTSTSPREEEKVLETFHRSPRKSVLQASRELKISKII